MTSPWPAASLAAALAALSAAKLPFRGSFGSALDELSTHVWNARSCKPRTDCRRPSVAGADSLAFLVWKSPILVDVIV